MRNTSPPVRTLDDLVAYFHGAEKPRSKWRVGAEAEKFAVTETGTPVGYSGPGGIAELLDLLSQKFGWHPVRETIDGPVIALKRREASITLEPGGQVELSGAPHESVHDICREFRTHIDELAMISEGLGIRWIGIGFHPFARREQLEWVPKRRYDVMRGYMPGQGSMALDMMLRTTTVQANLDFSSEEDAMRKLRVALRIQPIVSAMFANSPIVEGVPGGDLSRRTRVWLNVDPDRTGLIRSLWDNTASYEQYARWAANVPMFFFEREGVLHRNTGQTFTDFLKNGFNGENATLKDWELHLSTLFPEARLKTTIEVRGADGQTTRMTCALPALWKGLLYDDQSLDEVDSTTSRLTFAEVERSRSDIAKHALDATLDARRVGEWAATLVRIAADGLDRQKSPDRKSESVHLERLKALVDGGRTPAHRILDAYEQSQDIRRSVFDITTI